MALFERLQTLTDEELAAELENKNLNQYGHGLVLSEINRRALQKSIQANFLPRWTGWVVLLASLLAALFSLIGLLR